MKTYEEIATAHKLNANTTKRFIAYMRTRWASEEATQCQTGYAGEWADRFRNGEEYARSDSYGQAVLDAMK